MGKTGAYKSGESPTGGLYVAKLILEAPTLRLGANTPTPTVSGTGDATPMQSPVLRLGLNANPETSQVPSKTGESKTGEYPTGGLEYPNLRLHAENTFEAPTATIGAGTPTPSVSGTGTATILSPLARLGLTSRSGQIGYGEWILDGQPIGTSTGETATYQTLELTERVQTESLLDVLRSLKTDEGKVDVLMRDDGGFVAVDRANGGNTFELIPPIARQPLREKGEYHVQRYEETLVSQTVEEWDVELEFVKADNRVDSPSISETPEGDEWGFSTRYGTIATSRVDADLLGTGEGGVQRFEIVARLTFSQAHVLEAALNRLGGTRVRDVPDAPNVAVDDTDDGVNTLMVDSPDGQSVVSDGEYVVQAWESERLNDAYQSVSLEVAVS